jgi:polyphosphate kinase
MSARPSKPKTRPKVKAKAKSTAAPAPASPAEPLHFLDRDRSILAFNERVLDWARRDDVPLLERLRFLTIVSSNLDEFFEVRAHLHLDALREGVASGPYSARSFLALSEDVKALVERQYTLFNDALSPALSRARIRIVPHGERNAAQRKWVREFFEREARPLLVPVGLDPAHPFPKVANKSLNFIVQLGGADAFGREHRIAIVKVPRSLPRVIALPARVSGKDQLFVTISSVIRAHLADMFPGRGVGRFSQFRITRHSDLEVDEDDVQDLRSALRAGLTQRHYGQAVRLEVSSGCSDELAAFLLREFELPEAALYRVHGPVNLVRLGQLIDLVQRPQLHFPPYRPAYPAGLPVDGSIFARLKRGDLLIHRPYESFDGVLAFLREAVRDPRVRAIKQTVYRTGNDSEWMGLLHEAATRGKEVTVVVELKARFDEEANIHAAERLEAVGAQVLYGVVGLKTHAKMLLITRREGRGLRRYGHLSTGNYNARTARLYTDLCHLTADPAITADMDALFMHLASHGRLPPMARLVVAPFALHAHILARIETVGRAAAKGQHAEILVRTNALTDEPIMRALVRAGQQGARIELIVRGACMLPGGVPGQTDNIRVRSVIGRFLEHTRVFCFRHGAQEEVWLSSADWMNRNMLRRVEVAWPILDAHLRARVLRECLELYLQDAHDAWAQGPDGRYTRLSGDPATSAQQRLMAQYGGESAAPLPGKKPRR